VSERDWIEGFESFKDLALKRPAIAIFIILCACLFGCLYFFAPSAKSAPENKVQTLGTHSPAINGNGNSVQYSQPSTSGKGK
jgi:hypothetical protein